MTATILAIDDDPVLLTFYETVLTQAGYGFQGVASGPEALSLLQRRSFDLVVLDLSMDGMDGLEVLRQIRLRESVDRLPLLMVSANYDQEPMEAALDGGANDYLTKPVPPALLLAKIRRHLKLVSSASPAPSAEGELGPGSRAGHYEIEKLIGHGSMGRVYRAQDTRLQRAVAIKILTNPQADHSARFRSEALAAARVSHPNVVTIHDVGDAPVPFIAMEFLEGTSLSQCSLPVEPAQALRWTLEILEGLEAVHAAGITHRDLKPENVMVTGTGRIKLMDFGVAQFHAQELETGGDGLAGTPQFMAPEQIDSSLGQIGPASDLFASGGLLLWMLSGQHPFPAAHPSQQLFTIIFGRPRPLPKLPGRWNEKLQPVLDRALQKSPDARFTSAQEFRERLRGILSEECGQ